MALFSVVGRKFTQYLHVRHVFQAELYLSFFPAIFAGSFCFYSFLVLHANMIVAFLRLTMGGKEGLEIKYCNECVM